jgi:hypothetical protein
MSLYDLIATVLELTCPAQAIFDFEVDAGAVKYLSRSEPRTILEVQSEKDCLLDFY